MFAASLANQIVANLSTPPTTRRLSRRARLRAHRV
jgi:hypothetical protein